MWKGAGVRYVGSLGKRRWGGNSMGVNVVDARGIGAGRVQGGRSRRIKSLGVHWKRWRLNGSN